ncbi:MAG: hypothetical protein K2K81_03675 [Muribaculaceae bacterium]|nr:hypothetical protein [Muribaculaceae bacterium]
MKKLLLTTLTVIGLCATANASHFIIKMDQDGNKEYLRGEPEGTSGESSRTRSDEQLFTVTPVFIYDQAKGIKPTPGQEAVSSDGSTPYSYLAFDDFVVMPWEMPAGEYDFFFSFESPEGYLFVAKEGVKIEGDTEIEVNAADAFVNHIEWDAVMPDGESPMTGTPIGRRDIEMAIHIFHTPNFSPLATLFYNIRKEDATDYSSAWEKQMIWINDASKFFMSQVITVVENGAQYYINMPAIGTSTQKIINDKDNFKHYTLNQPADWTAITGGKEPIKRGYYDYYGFIGTKQFLWVEAVTDTPSEKLYDQVYYCGPDKDVYCPLTLKPGLEIFTEIDPSMGRQFGITPPALEFTESGGFQFQTFRQNNSFDSFYTNYNFASDNKKRPGQNPFIALAENENPVFGSTTPFVLFSRPAVNFGFGYIGRCGELRTLDYLNQKFSIRLNGEEVWRDYFNQRDFFYTEDWQPGVAYEKGMWEYEIESGNLTVDGLQSNTHCLMQFGESDDFTWPTLTALQFRDKDGHVTERFDNPSDGKLIFMGGEWSTNEDYPSIFECVAPKELTVEYAPYGSEDFQTLDYEHIAEKRYMPGYGEYYEASLSQVATESATGWYGVKLTMTDSQGNRQTQTVTPAFYVAHVSSVNDINSANPLEIRVENGEIIAPSDARIYNIEGKRMMSNRVAPGIYIVRRGAQSVKAIVR